ncbi:MAG: hypothetical protein NC410_10070 [Oscillibacter sp.]|nr:hypothetical protein [Oscillibacter sp.]
MRKIAANYVFLPGLPLLRQGYVVWEDGAIRDVVDTGGELREIHGLEFYGGMLVSAALLKRQGSWQAGQPLLPFLTECYKEPDGAVPGLALIKGADLKRMVFCEGTVIERLL